MKKILLISALSLLLLATYGQGESNVIDQKFRDIIIRQLFNNLKVETTSGLPVSYTDPFLSSEYFNKSVLYNESYIESNDFTNVSEYSKVEFKNFLNFAFISPFLVDSNVSVRARYKNKILYELDYDHGSQIVNLSFPKNEIKESTYYENNRLKKMIIQEKDKLDILNYKELGDNKALNIYYNSHTELYYRIEYIKHNAFFAEDIFYYESSKRTSQLIEKTVHYSFDTKGRLFHKNVIDADRDITDSIKYFYEEDKIHRIIRYHLGSQRLIFYKYNDEGLLVNKDISKGETPVNIEYVYDSEKRIAQYKINKQSNYVQHKYIFKYNDIGNLQSINYLKVDINTKDIIDKIEYEFGYSKNQKIETLKKIDAKGRIKKEVHFEIGEL